MTNDLARWQFATTSIYHFLFVPVTIGLAFLVALLQTVWYRNQGVGGPELKRATKFFGTLLLINVAIGVVTGLVQEFEFGMNWSAYSRFVGDVFGGPLAMEGLAAFFLESTFLGLWIFGWDRLPKRIHLACIWLVAAGSMLSAMFILAANSWMQHPVGYKLSTIRGKPVLNNMWSAVHQSDVPVGLRARDPGLAGHRLAGHARRCRRGICASAGRRPVFHQTRRGSSVLVLLPAIMIQMFVGNKLGEIEATYQPAKIAAAEAQWEQLSSRARSRSFRSAAAHNDQTPSQIIADPPPALGAGGPAPGGARCKD